LAGQELSRGQIKKPEEIMREIDKIGKNDILRVARNVFSNEALNLAAIGPIKDKAYLEKILKL
jgi:predicted Zn-dependent peptidase